MPNVVARDHRLSWRARGLLLELLSYPPGWETTIDELVKEAARRGGGATEGRDAMRAAARELKAVGYLIAHKHQDKRGRWRTDLELTDAPMWELVNTQLALQAPADVSEPENDRRRDSSRRSDLQKHGDCAGGTDDGKPAVGSPVVGGPGVIPKKVPKNDPDPNAHARKQPAAVVAESRTEGRTEDASLTEEPSTAVPQSGLLDVDVEVLARAGEIATGLNLRKQLDARPRQVAQVTRALAEALMRPGVDAAAVKRYAAAKVAEARTVKYVLTAFEPAHLLAELPAYLDDRQCVTRPAWCGNCDERTRLREDSDGFRRCSDCHPLTVAGAA